jgi:hypothetical protein
LTSLVVSQRVMSRPNNFEEKYLTVRVVFGRRASKAKEAACD